VISPFATFWSGCAILVASTTLFSPTDPPKGFDFAHDVLPILQRSGCSSAYCHGSATGRAGFKLSLFGSDSAADYEAITTEFGGRRLDLRNPERSLLVQKAIGNLAHGGGRRLLADSSALVRLRDWVAAGAPFRNDQRSELSGLHAAIVGGRVIATATFQQQSSTRDVSDVALFSTSDPTVVDVDVEGALTFHGQGQAHLTARFGNLTATVRVVRPFGELAPFGALTPLLAPGRRSSLDRAWQAHLAELGLAIAEPVTSAQLARRLHLDLVGRPPTPQELDHFVGACDGAGNRVTAITESVARLSKRREFSEVWGAHLGDWFELQVEDATGPAAQAVIRLRSALVQAVAASHSLPVIARRLVLGQQPVGNTDSGMIERFTDARDRAEYAGRTLLGKRIGCARCHDHPSDRWRQSEHLAFSACFAVPRPDGMGGMMAGAMFDADSGQAVTPRFLDLSASGANAKESIAQTVDGRRAQLADYLLSLDHDAFAVNACNRVFAIVFGRGLVEPVDDHRLGNPPVDDGMLQALIAKFHVCEGQLPDLLTFLMTSSTYSAPTVAGDDRQDHAAVEHFARQASRALPARTFARALAAVVGRESNAAIPATALARELAVRNGPIVRELLAAEGTTIDATFDLCAGPKERVVELWRTVLSRAPREEELARFLPFASERDAYRDLAFALLTGREFGHRR
jgi:hypothetical protein